MKKLMNKVSGFMKNEEGQGLVEYALIIALVALLVVAALKIFSSTISNKYNNIGENLTGQ